MKRMRVNRICKSAMGAWSTTPSTEAPLYSPPPISPSGETSMTPPFVSPSASIPRDRISGRAFSQAGNRLIVRRVQTALVEAVLLGLARRDVMPADAGVVGPGQDSVRGVLHAVIADDGVGPAPPRCRMTASNSRTTLAPDSEVSAASARHSRVQLSITVKMRKGRPSIIWSEAKSNDQRWLATIGRSSGRRVPIARFRPPRRRTVSRSSR